MHYLQLSALFVSFFFCQGFLSQKLMIHRTAREWRGLSFIPLYYFDPLTNIETFISNFACEMNIPYFKSQRLCLPDVYSMRFTILSNYHWLIDWWCSVCLFTWWIDSRFSLQRLEMRNQWIWTLVLQANQLNNCVSHP